MLLKFKNGFYWIKCSWEERKEPEKAGFTWNRPMKLWFTDDPFRAKSFILYSVDRGTRARLERDLAELHCGIEWSKASTTDYNPPCPEGLSYLPYQKAGIEYSVCNSRGGVLIADEMGLGKTIQAIGYMNVTHPNNVLIVCPATVKLNWQNELIKWMIHYTPSGVAYGSEPFPDTPIVIINYDILMRFHDEIHSKTWKLLVSDECHYLKNPEAKRTLEVLGSKRDKVEGIKTEKKIFLTGTPILNKPKEIFPVLNYLDPKTFPSFYTFGKRYCGGFNAETGWDFNGASNLEELNVKLRTSVMIRRLKKDVLKDLPPKIRQIIEIKGDKRIMKEEVKRFTEFKKQVQSLDIGVFESLAELAKIRHETALSKVPAVINHLKDIIDQGQKVICFAWHRDVIKKIDKAFDENACLIMGDTPVKLRQAAVDRFQNDKNSRLFLGNIKAAGVGINLSAASVVVFAELDWVPGVMTQAEDRPHRIGQKSSVLVQHLVLTGSIDAFMAKILIRKQEIIDKALDGKEEAKDERLVAKEVIDQLFRLY